MKGFDREWDVYHGLDYSQYSSMPADGRRRVQSWSCLRCLGVLRAIEMESASVYRAARGRCPMLPIRGISDIVGLKRADDWTKFACASAAAFTRAFLRTRPIPTSSNLRWVIVLRGNAKSLDSDILARAVEALRQLSGDITLQITDVQDGSIRLTVVMSPTGVSTLLELRRNGEFAQLCGFDVLDLVEIPASQATAQTAVTRPSIAQRRATQVSKHQHAHLDSVALATGVGPAESVARDWVRGYDPSRDIVYAPAEQRRKSRIDPDAEEAAVSFLRRGLRAEAIRVLMTAYRAPIAAFAFRIVRDPETANDILQQVFLDVFQAPDKFEHRSSL